MQVDIEVLRERFKAGADEFDLSAEMLAVFDRSCLLAIQESSNGQPAKRKRSYTRKPQPAEQPAGE